MKRSRPSCLSGSALSCCAFSRIFSCGVSGISVPRVRRAHPARAACACGASRGRPRAGPGRRRRRPASGPAHRGSCRSCTGSPRPQRGRRRPRRRARTGAPAGPRRARAFTAGWPSLPRARGRPRVAERGRGRPVPTPPERLPGGLGDRRLRVRRRHPWDAAAGLGGDRGAAVEKTCRHRHHRPRACARAYRPAGAGGNGHGARPAPALRPLPGAGGMPHRAAAPALNRPAGRGRARPGLGRGRSAAAGRAPAPDLPSGRPGRRASREPARLSSPRSDGPGPVGQAAEMVRGGCPGRRQISACRANRPVQKLSLGAGWTITASAFSAKCARSARGKLWPRPAPAGARPHGWQQGPCTATKKRQNSIMT